MQLKGGVEDFNEYVWDHSNICSVFRSFSVMDQLAECSLIHLLSSLITSYSIFIHISFRF